MKKVLLFLLMGLFLSYGCKFFKKKTAAPEDTLVTDTTQRVVLESDTTALVPPQVSLPAEEHAAPVVNGKYYMIVGCFTVPQNADNFVVKLKGMGYEPQILPGTGGFQMVSARSYNSWKEIVAELDRFRNDVEPAAWVYVVK
jgi:hypothetical protein